MVFDFYHDHAQPLDRIQVGKYLIVRSSSPSNCVICGTKTFWRDSDEMKPVCEKQCLFYLHQRSRNLFAAFKELLKEGRNDRISP